MIHPSSRTSPTSSDRIGRGFPGHSAGGSEVAETLAREALDMASATGILAGWTGGLGVSLETALTSASKQGKVEAAAVRGEGLSRSEQPTVESTQARLVLAGARIARGRLALAREDLAHAERMLTVFRDPGCLRDQAARLRKALTRAEATREIAAFDEPLSPAELAVLKLLPSELSLRASGRDVI